MLDDLIGYETLLDAARLHFAAVARSPNFTREAREVALEYERAANLELESYNCGNPLRFLERFDKVVTPLPSRRERIALLTGDDPEEVEDAA